MKWVYQCEATSICLKERWEHVDIYNLKYSIYPIPNTMLSGWNINFLLTSFFSEKKNNFFYSFSSLYFGENYGSISNFFSFLIHCFIFRLDNEALLPNIRSFFFCTVSSISIFCGVCCCCWWFWYFFRTNFCFSHLELLFVSDSAIHSHQKI